MPATQVTRVTTPGSFFATGAVGSDLSPGGDAWPLDLSAVSWVALASLLSGVRSSLLAYSEDGSRRSGVACLVRAMAGRGWFWLGELDARRGEKPKPSDENLDDSRHRMRFQCKREMGNGKTVTKTLCNRPSGGKAERQETSRGKHQTRVGGGGDVVDPMVVGVVGGMLQLQHRNFYGVPVGGQDPDIRPAWLFGADSSRFPTASRLSPHRASRLAVLVARLAVPCR